MYFVDIYYSICYPVRGSQDHKESSRGRFYCWFKAYRIFYRDDGDRYESIKSQKISQYVNRSKGGVVCLEK